MQVKNYVHDLGNLFWNLSQGKFDLCLLLGCHKCVLVLHCVGGDLNNTHAAMFGYRRHLSFVIGEGKYFSRF